SRLRPWGTACSLSGSRTWENGYAATPFFTSAPTTASCAGPARYCKSLGPLTAKAATPTPPDSWACKAPNQRKPSKNREMAKQYLRKKAMGAEYVSSLQEGQVLIDWDNRKGRMNGSKSPSRTRSASPTSTSVR